MTKKRPASIAEYIAVKARENRYVRVTNAMRQLHSRSRVRRGCSAPVRALLLSLIVMGAIAVLAACQPEAPPPKNRSMTPGVLAEAFRHFSSPGDKALVHCLQVDGKDPPNMTLAILLAEDKNVAPASECRFDPNDGAYHVASKRPAEFERINALRQVSPAAMQFDYQSYRGGLDGHGGSCEMELEPGGHTWRVTRCTATSIS